VTELVYCGTVTFKMTERAVQLHHDSVPANSIALMQAFFGKASYHSGPSAPYRPDLAPCNFWLFPKLKSLLRGRRIVNAKVTQYTSSVHGTSLPTA